MSEQTVYGVDVVDIHVGGDVHRIVLDGISDLPGTSVFEKMHYLKHEADGLRRLLLDEPRGGHPALFADLIVKPGDNSADAGFIIMEGNGYHMFSGTNIISTAIALLEVGRLPMHEGTMAIQLEAPGGLVEVWAKCQNGRVMDITCLPSKPAFAYATDLQVDIPDWGEVKYDIFWAGEFFPIIDPTLHGFKLESGEEHDLGAFAKTFIETVRDHQPPRHPEINDVTPLRSVTFAGPLCQGGDGRAERCVVPYIYPGRQVGRCPAGMPSSVAIAQLHTRGQCLPDAKLRTLSPTGSSLEVQITGEAMSGPFNGIFVSVTGRGWTIARSTLVVDLSDPMTPEDGLASILNMPLPPRHE